MLSTWTTLPTVATVRESNTMFWEQWFFSEPTFFLLDRSAPKLECVNFIVFLEADPTGNSEKSIFPYNICSDSLYPWPGYGWISAAKSRFLTSKQVLSISHCSSDKKDAKNGFFRKFYIDIVIRKFSQLFFFDRKKIFFEKWKIFFRKTIIEFFW